VILTTQEDIPRRHGSVEPIRVWRERQVGGRPDGVAVLVGRALTVIVYLNAIDTTVVGSRRHSHPRLEHRSQSLGESHELILVGDLPQIHEARCFQRFNCPEVIS
jgi:hypothetical protein